MNREASVDKACRAIEEAGKNGAELVLFSETFIPGYPYWRGVLPISKWTKYMVEYQKNAVKVPSEDTKVLGDAAANANTFCAIGITELDDRVGSHTLYNSILFLDNKGRVLGRHRKLMPTHAERMIWGMGDASDIRVFDTEIGRIGGLVCYENHMTLVKGAMAQLGEEIHCAVWPGWWVMERHPGSKRRFNPLTDSVHSCDIEPAIREYAFETQTFVLSANAYMPDRELPEDCQGFNVAAGGSTVINPAGLHIAEPVFDKETIIYATLNADDWRSTKAYFDCVGHYSRPDILHLEVAKGKA